MCRSDERTHKHHIIPKYMGGPDTPENIVEVSVTQHAMFHFCNYQLWGNEEDRIAWRTLSGQITLDEAKLEVMALGGKKAGNKHKENKTGVCGLTFEQKSEIGKRGGKTTYERKTGFFKMSLEEKIEHGKKVAEKNKENGTAVYGLTFAQRSEAGKMGGQKTYEEGIGIHGMTFEQRSENSKKNGKTTSSQKWKCTITGYVTSPGPLTNFQKKRGIDPSNRIRIQ